jgi:zinc resistance-associated protein
MLRTVAAGAAALMLAAGAAAFAQQPPAGPDFGRRQFAPEDRAAFLDARVAALHAGLRLTAEQEKAWPAFEQAWRDLAGLRGNRPSVPRADESLDPVQRMQRMADVLTSRGAALKRYADAMGPLYQSLDDNQKRRFGLLSRMGMEHGFRRFAFLHSGDRSEFGGHEFGPREFGPPRGEFRLPRGQFPPPRGETGPGEPSPQR